MVTLPTDTEILITREFDAPKNLVYRAYTEPDLVSRWWPGKRGEMTLCDIDLRVGGSYRYVMNATGGFEVGFHGTYREIDADRRIIHTEVFEGIPNGDDDPALNIITFEETDGRTTLTMLTRVSSRQIRDMIIDSGMEGGMQEGMDLLEEIAKSLADGFEQRARGGSRGVGGAGDGVDRPRDAVEWAQRDACASFSASSGNNVTASPRATSARATVAFSDRWRMSGSSRTARGRCGGSSPPGPGRAGWPPRPGHRGHRRRTRGRRAVLADQAGGHPPRVMGPLVADHEVDAAERELGQRGLGLGLDQLAAELRGGGGQRRDRRRRDVNGGRLERGDPGPAADRARGGGEVGLGDAPRGRAARRRARPAPAPGRSGARRGRPSRAGARRSRARASRAAATRRSA